MNTLFDTGDFFIPRATSIDRWHDENNNYRMEEAPLERGKRYQVQGVFLHCLNNHFGKEVVVEHIAIPYLEHTKWYFSKVLGFPTLSAYQNSLFRLQTSGKKYFGKPQQFGILQRKKLFFFELLQHRGVEFGTFYAQDFMLAPDSEELKKEMIINIRRA